LSKCSIINYNGRIIKYVKKEKNVNKCYRDRIVENGKLWEDLAKEYFWIKGINEDINAKYFF